MAATLRNGARGTLSTRMPPKPTARVPILLLVLGLHMALYWATQQRHGAHVVRRGPSAPPLKPLWLRWIDERTRTEEPRSTPSRSTQPSPASSVERKATSQPRARERMDQAEAVAPFTPSQPAAALEGGGPVKSNEDMPPRGVPSRTPLDLTLPRGASAPWRRVNPALERADLERPSRTIEAVIAGGMGSGHGPWTEERVDADTVRLRRGEVCVLLKRSRIDNLDPYNASVSPKPWMVSLPTPCR